MARKKKTNGEDDTAVAASTLPQPSKVNAYSLNDLTLSLSAATRMITRSAKRASTARNNGLLDLPTEIRGAIYKNVLAVDDDTYDIEGISACRRTRHRDIYRVTNVDRHHLAILAVTKQIRAEVKALVPSKIIRFKNTRAFDYFLLDRDDEDEDKLKIREMQLLSAAKGVQVVVGKRPTRSVRKHWAELSDILSGLVSELRRIDPVDDEGNDMSAERVRILCRYHLAKTRTN